VLNLITFSLILLYGQDLWAAKSFGVSPYISKTNCVLESLVGRNNKYKKKLNGKQRAIEYETSVDMVLKYTTTSDGTLNGFFKGADGIDPGFEPWFIEKFGESFKTRKWSNLSAADKKEIMNKITKYQEFFQRRTIPGLEFRSGDHAFSEFENYVELGAPKDAGDIKLIEIHLRGEERASELALKVRKVAKRKGAENGVSLHAHIPFKIRVKQLQARPMVESAKHADYYRRTELFSQFTTIMNISDDLKPVLTGNAINFEKMSGPRKLRQIWSSFYEKGINPDGKLEMFEKNYVGLRGEGIYDQPDLWGIEVRSLNKKLDDKQTRALLDGFESSGLREDFGLKPKQIEEWLGDIPSPYSQIRNFSEKLYPEYRFSEHYTNHLTPAELKVWKKLKFKSGEADERWKFIMHDWSEDVLFYNNPAALEAIRVARIRAMRRQLKDEKPIEIARAFLVESGIYRAFGESLGIKVLK
jgi:hypothetical protein